METTTAVTELQRRKQVRLSLRRDLVFAAQRYEGRIYHVVKDPVSLRYGRFSEQEEFLLRLLDGEHTLEDARQAFERQFRPERLSLEEMEAFATELLQAGFVRNDLAPGPFLWHMGQRRRRGALPAALLNVFSIRLPLLDPNRLLTALLRPLRFLFTPWFVVLSLGVLVAALAKVATHWSVFLARLPGAGEIFSLSTLLYLWLSLGLVKIFHEFGHGLTCKAFGGEVTEMGVLLLLFSPCLYCNVSDAWMQPSKWKRMAVSAAGIYTELLIASVATFVWWATDRGTLVNRLCLSLMTVCSVHTVLFNANPLMRLDGYYILSDWLEIPNLADRARRFLQALLVRHLLGVEASVEPAGTRARQCLFVCHAVAGYLYRWAITFAILYGLYLFLQPRKLGAVALLLALVALAAMFAWPVHRLLGAVRREGRWPRMKPVRVGLLVGLAGLTLLALCTVPLPMRVQGLALIQVEPEQVHKILVPHSGGFVQTVLVRDGQRVRAGDVVAILSHPDLEIGRRLNEADQALRRSQQGALAAEANVPGMAKEAAGNDFKEVAYELQSLVAEEAVLRKQQKRLILRAPCDGTVLGLQSLENQGKWQEAGVEVCRIGDERALRAVLPVRSADRELVPGRAGAWIHIHGLGGSDWPGVVTEIAKVESRDLPPQLSSRLGGEVATAQDPDSKTERPRDQHYLIAVRFQRTDAVLQPGAMCRVKIEVPSQSLGRRLLRSLAATFNGDL